MKPTISKPFKSNDRTFDKVYNAFDKRDYFNSKGLAKTQIGNFERALQKNDKGAQQILDLFKGDEKKAKDYITQIISDRNKERAFNNYKALKDAVDSIQKGKPNFGAVDYVKRIIHNSSQKYSIALYSSLRNKKFTKWNDVHNDIDSLIGEGFKSDAQRKAAFANGYEEKGKKKNESVNEGKKRYYQQDRVGSAKYTISYHDGKKKHKDGSDFFDIQTFRNKKDLAKFVNTLHKGGYVYGFNESVNEILVIVDKFDKRKQDYGKVYYQDGGKRPGDGDIEKAKKELDKLSKKHKGLTLVSVGRNSKMYDVMDESVNEAYVVLYSPKKGVKPVSTAAYKDKKDAEKWAKDLGGITMIVKKNVRYIDEGISVSDERHFGKKGIIIMIDDNGKKVSAIFKDKKNADKFNRNKPSDIKKLLDLAKKTKYPKAIDESEDGVPQGYNPMVEDKNQIIQINKKSNKNETKFYDILSTIEKKLGKRKYRLWLEKSLKDFGENPKHYDYRTNASIEEKLFQVSK